MNVFKIEKNVEKMKEVLYKVFEYLYIVIDGKEKDEFFKFLEEWKLPLKIELFNYNKIHSIAVYYVPHKIYIRLRSNDNGIDSEAVINLLELFIAGELDTIERIYQFTQKLSKEMGVEYEYIDEY